MINAKEILIVGSNGQLGRALHDKYPGAVATDITQLDITSSNSVKNFDWAAIKVIINAAAYTKVDEAQTPEGRIEAWKVNAEAVSYLAQAAIDHDLTLVHISSEYVFNGENNLHKEDEPLSPLGVYAQTKAAGDIVVGTVPKHYIVRTSWVIGDGKNFVRTMLRLGAQGISPSVINDDVGRPTFTTTLVGAIDHLLSQISDYGTYNVSDDGEPTSWAGLTREIFKSAGFNLSVTNVTDNDYYADKPNASPRPQSSIFDLRKIKSTGFMPTDWHENLAKYIKKEIAQ